MMPSISSVGVKSNSFSVWPVKGLTVAYLRAAESLAVFGCSFVGLWVAVTGVILVSRRRRLHPGLPGAARGSRAVTDRPYSRHRRAVAWPPERREDRAAERR